MFGEEGERNPNTLRILGKMKTRDLGIEVCMFLFVILMALSVRIGFVRGFFLSLLGFLLTLKIVVLG